MGSFQGSHMDATTIGNVAKYKTTICDNELVFSQIMINVINSIC